eukprot:TRINITY_DN6204_c0_g1_i1.p1 TRINITY_DN6204_c0_g1~~TRINITY_DN6204_c0_g1_i1.p1  ORF type:complete len:501 (+),score=28.03 TRINITY_DN6204_c0_g1_i1:99-1505(+)
MAGRHRLWSLISFILLIQTIEATVSVTFSNGTTIEFGTLSYKEGSEGLFSPVSGPLLVIPQVNNAPSIAGANVTGRIVVCPARALAFFWEWVTQQSPTSGIAAFLIADGQDGALGGLSTVPIPKSFPFPILGISRTSAGLLDTWTNTMNLTLRATVDPVSVVNPFFEILSGGGFWFCRLAIIFVSFGLIILAVGRLIQFYTALGKFELNVVNGVLMLELCGLALRLVYWAIGPLGSIPKVWNDESKDAWHTVSIPFAVNSTLLLTFFWWETVSYSSVKFSFSIETLKIPAIILCVLVFLVEIIIDALVVGRSRIPNLAIINSAIYLVLGLALAIFFIVTSSRVLFRLLRISKRTPRQASSETKKSSVKKRIIPVAIKLLLTAFAWLGIIACGVTTTSSGFGAYRPEYIIWVWTFLHVFLTTKAASTISALRAPRTLNNSPQRTDTATSTGKSSGDSLNVNVGTHASDV